VLAVHSTSQQSHVSPPLAVGPAAPAQRETPLDILARRFASGDITADEYEKAKKLLTDS
jgi:Short C-terminal domain